MLLRRNNDDNTGDEDEKRSTQRIAKSPRCGLAEYNESDEDLDEDEHWGANSSGDRIHPS